MSTDQILLLYFGLPLVILGMGLRRALRQRMLLVLLGGALVAVYALIMETLLRRWGHGLPLPGMPGQSLGRGFGLYGLAGGLLGALGAALFRFRGQGSIHQ